MTNLQPRIVGIIPARYASTRLPGKALCPILGKPMIQRASYLKISPLSAQIAARLLSSAPQEQARGTEGEPTRSGQPNSVPAARHASTVVTRSLKTMACRQTLELDSE
jgi:hypothetical protein